MSIDTIWTDYRRKREASLPWLFLRVVFGALSYLVLLGYYLLAFLYRSGLIKTKTLKAKVISVGNITLGGTGKTPLVLCIAEYLKSTGENFAVLTRGYKRKSKRMIELGGRKLPWEKVGDEPYMLSLKLSGVPIFIHKNRFEAGKKALSRHNIKTFILDDGFQHWQLQRDVDIVIIDCLNPFGAGRVFPAGYLREPLAASRRADVFVLNRVDQATNVDKIKRVLNRYNPEALMVESIYLLDAVHDFKDYSLVDPEGLKGKRFVAFSGIANPFSFEKTLDGSGIKIMKHFRFSDHFPYRAKDISRLEKNALNSGAEALLTTQKDGVRIPEIRELQIPIYVVSIKLKITRGEKDFWRVVGSS